MNRVYQVLVACCWLILAGCATKITPPTTHVYDRMDEFLAELASRAKAKIAPTEDIQNFQIVVTQAYYPIG